MSWGLAPTMAYPDSVLTVMDGFEEAASIDSTVLIRPGLPQGFQYDKKLIVVARVGGGPDDDDITDYPVMQIGCYAPTYPLAAELSRICEVEILGWPHRQIGPNKILVDEAEIYVGEQEIPDIFPDERRKVASYRLGWRRQIWP